MLDRVAALLLVTAPTLDCVDALAVAAGLGCFAALCCNAILVRVVHALSIFPSTRYTFAGLVSTPQKNA